MAELDDAGIRARLRRPHGNDLRRRAQRIAFEQRGGKFHFGHAEIGDGRSDSRVVDGHADHETEREERIQYGPPPFGFGGTEMRVDVERLRIQGHVRKQHIVHLRHRPGQPMVEDMAGDEIIEIEAAARVRRLRRLGRHLRFSLSLLDFRRPPSGAYCRGLAPPFRIRLP